MLRCCFYRVWVVWLLWWFAACLIAVIDFLFCLFICDATFGWYLLFVLAWLLCDWRWFVWLVGLSCCLIGACHLYFIWLKLIILFVFVFVVVVLIWFLVFNSVELILLYGVTCLFFVSCWCWMCFWVLVIGSCMFAIVWLMFWFGFVFDAMDC